MSTWEKAISIIRMGRNEFDRSTDLSKESAAVGPSRLRTARLVQNFHLVWLDRDIDENNNDFRNSITKLRQVVNTVNTFIDADECIHFISSIQQERAFLVCSGALGQTTVRLVHDLSQLNAIYIFCSDKPLHEKWAKEWTKVAGVYTDIVSICAALKQATQDFDHNSISISFAPKDDGAGSENRDTLHCSFMYTQILKEILLTINFEQVHIENFLMFCHERFAGNPKQLQNVDLIERDYRRHEPIWWYTYECFLYSMLNRALGLMEVDLIIKMGFFLRDLHNHIVALHREQYAGRHGSHSFTVYRGQGLSETRFTRLKATQGGLLAFNNFLSTSHNPEVSLAFARRKIATSDSIGVLFVMIIDPSLSTTAFANVKDVSYYKGEEEILFSMHAVFRVGQVKQIENNERLYQVDLTLTGDHDQQLYRLTERMREETSSGSQGWYRLGHLLIQMGQFDKAEELYGILLHQATTEAEQGYLYNQLGGVKGDQGDYAAAVEYHEKSIAIKQKTLPPTHANLAASYNNIGLVYHKMGEYSKALSSHERALDIKQKTLPASHPDLATSYNNIGMVYDSMGEYSKALSYYEQALKIRQKTLPANHPHLAQSYNNIGLLHDNMGQYSKALSSHEQALEIYQKTLPGNHPDLASSYNSIGMVYKNMGEYAKVLSHCEQALEIERKTLPANHPDLATSYNNIGWAYKNMGEYSKALSSHEQALEIRQKILPANHPDLATSYDNIGSVYENMGEYSKALSYYEQALKIFQKTLPANHPDLAASYNNIGMVYDKMGEYSKALFSHEQALEIRQKALPANDSHLTQSYNNIGKVYNNMSEYSKALSYYKQALEILLKTLPAIHPDLAISYNNIATVYYNMGEYSKALSSHEQALEIRQKTLPASHPDLATSYNNIGTVYNSMGEYSKALTYYERALNICRRSLPPNHSHLESLKQSIEIVKKQC